MQLTYLQFTRTQAHTVAHKPSSVQNPIGKQYCHHVVQRNSEQPNIANPLLHVRCEQPSGTSSRLNGTAVHHQHVRQQRSNHTARAISMYNGMQLGTCRHKKLQAAERASPILRNHHCTKSLVTLYSRCLKNCVCLVRFVATSDPDQFAGVATHTSKTRDPTVATRGC